MALILGIDPGISGAVTVLKGSSTSFKILEITDLPINTEERSNGKKRRSINIKRFRELIENIIKNHGLPDLVVVEKMIASPYISGLSAFSLGYTQGIISATLQFLDIVPTFVYPFKWKGALNVKADKTEARRRATELFKNDNQWPRVKDHNRAESALIAFYGLML